MSKITESILNKSNSFNYYKKEYHNLNEELKIKNKEIEFLNNKIKEDNKTISELNHKIEKNQKYFSKLNRKIGRKQDNIIRINKKNRKNNILVPVLEKRLTRICEENDFKNLHDINIAYVLRAFPIHSETFIVNEIRWLKDNGFNVVIFCNGTSPKSIELDFDYELIKFRDSLDLAKLLVDKKIDYVHTHFVYPTCTNYTYPVCEKLKIPYTVFAHAYDIFVKENAKRNKIFEISHSRYCKGIYTLSNFHKNYLINQNANPDKIIITKQATEYEINEINRKENKIKQIISISRFVEKKGIDTLIDAAKILEDEDYEFSIYGYGVLEDTLQSQIDDLDCSNISIKGELLPEEVDEILKKSDLLVSPCKIAENGDMDGFHTVIFEAMATGLPVLTTDVSAIPEIIEDNENGFLVPSDNPSALAKKIKKISDLSDEEMFKIRKQAQNDVKELSSTDKTMDLFVKVIEESLNI